MRKKMLILGASLLLLAGWARADYASITVDGDFSDWAGVSAAPITQFNTGTGLDFLQVQIANDENYFYLRYTTASTAASGDLYFSVDKDQDWTTGFDVHAFGALGGIGADASWEGLSNPFEMGTGVWNTGNGLSNATLTASPSGVPTTSVEFSISRSATHTVSGSPVFDDAVNVMLWNLGGDAVSASYTLAAIPEPGTGLLTLVGLGAAAWFMRRKRS